MIICDKITDEKNIQHNDKCLQIPDHHFKLLTFGGSETCKSNALPNLIYKWWDISKIWVYAKDLKERKHEYLINKQSDVVIKHFNAPNAFILYSNDINDVLFQNITHNNATKNCKILVFFNNCFQQCDV